NTTDLPDDVWQKIRGLTRERWLISTPGEHRTAPVPSNGRPYRQWSAAVKCVEGLMETTPPAYTAFVTLTTRCRDAKWANQKLSTILEKVLAPFCIKWVRFFDRGENGYIHWHLVVALKFAVLNTDYEFWTLGES